MKKRERGALSFRVRKVTSLFFFLAWLALLFDACNGLRRGNEWGGAGRRRSLLRLSWGTSRSMAMLSLSVPKRRMLLNSVVRCQSGQRFSLKTLVRENAAGGAEDSDDVVPDERERSLLRGKAPLSAMSMPTDLSLSMPG